MSGGGSSQPKIALTKEDVTRILSPIVVGKAGIEPEINKLFKMQIKLEASDMHLQCGKPIGPTYAPGSIQANFSSSRVQIETRSLSCPDQYLGIHSSHEFTMHERKKMR